MLRPCSGIIGIIDLLVLMEREAVRTLSGNGGGKGGKHRRGTVGERRGNVMGTPWDLHGKCTRCVFHLP